MSIGRAPVLPIAYHGSTMTMTRREAIKLAAAAGAAALTSDVAAQPGSSKAAKTPVFEIFELTCPGPRGGNPFTDVTLTAEFSLSQRIVKVRGFYDGEGTYKIRFMPDIPGTWSYRTESNRQELDGTVGCFRLRKLSLMGLFMFTTSITSHTRTAPLISRSALPATPGFINQTNCSARRWKR